MTTLFRGMTNDGEGLPLVGRSARMLGVRPDVDILVDESGHCRGGEGGMSVAYDTPQHLPEHRRPPSHGGTGPDPVWDLDEGDLPDGLVFRKDEDLEGHGFIEPAWTMDVSDYEDALAVTRSSWRINN